PGLGACFQALEARGLKMALATSAPRFAVNDFFASVPEIDQMLCGKVCGDEVTNGKPAPEIFLKAAALTGHAPAQCLGVEDSPSGLQAIRACGAYAVMIPDLHPFTDELKPYADSVLRSLAELPALIDRLNQK
ncbi:MAG: HAD family phosphatase, partial [Firmicutes bacterium]|nr:HAD family phosphatase [Bacillota bacterium]